MKIIRATIGHSLEVARLFDLYRQFYGCQPDPALARSFIAERIRNNESIIFLAQDDSNNVAGFVQLYPSFCSVDAAKILILYDLFTDPDHRRKGAAKQLMNRAQDYAIEAGAKRLDLLTEKTNTAGQTLYESLEYKKTNQDFYAYSLELASPSINPG